MAPSVVLVVAVAALSLAWLFGVVRMFMSDGDGSTRGGLDPLPVRVGHSDGGRARRPLASSPGRRSPSFHG